MKNLIQREITPLKESDCFLVFDKSRKGFYFPIHFHPEFEINYISNATGAKRIVGDHTGVISKKELIMVGPNLYHGWENYRNNTNSTLHEITIQFPRELFSESFVNRHLLMPIRELLNNSKRGILFSEEVIRLVEPQLMALVNKSGFDSFLEFQSLIYNLAISRDQQLLIDKTFQHQNGFHNSKQMDVLYNYIKENYTEKLKIEDAANMLNMSVASFNRLLKKRTGKSFVDFVNSYRLEMATQALINTNKSISEICYDCGFNNISNFNRIFRKYQKCTPGDFRKDFVGMSNIR